MHLVPPEKFAIAGGGPGTMPKHHIRAVEEAALNEQRSIGTVVNSEDAFTDRASGVGMGEGLGPLFLSVAAAAEALAVSDDAIYDLLRRCELPSLRIGRRRVIPRRAVELVVDHLMSGFDPEQLAARLSASQV